MQLVSYDQPLKLNYLDKPTPTSNQLLLKIHAVGMNFGDTLLMKGTYQEKPELPFTLGMEICGTIEAVGKNVSNFSIGDRVAVYSGFGGLAEYGCFEATECVSVPKSMPSEDAAAFLVAYGTSHIALERRAKLSKGETLLVLEHLVEVVLQQWNLAKSWELESLLARVVRKNLRYAIKWVQII